MERKLAATGNEVVCPVKKMIWYNGLVQDLVFLSFCDLQELQLC